MGQLSLYGLGEKGGLAAAAVFCKENTIFNSVVIRNGLYDMFVDPKKTLDYGDPFDDFDYEKIKQWNPQTQKFYRINE